MSVSSVKKAGLILKDVGWKERSFHFEMYGATRHRRSRCQSKGVFQNQRPFIGSLLRFTFRRLIFKQRLVDS